VTRGFCLALSTCFCHREPYTFHWRSACLFATQWGFPCSPPFLPFTGRSAPGFWLRSCAEFHCRTQTEGKTPLKANLDSVISGKVTYDGDPPIPKIIEAINKPQNRGRCLNGAAKRDTVDPTWRVDKKGGVANVVIWLEPPAEKYFNLAEADKKRNDIVILDMPHCAFVPHVVAVFPKYFDGNKLVNTGQFLHIKNSAPFPHNVKWIGDGITNKSFNHTLRSRENRDIWLNPQDEPLQIGSNIHTWMSGFIWIFDNPYNAVTKDDGTFSIRNVPTDVELTLVGWHEAKQKFFQKKMTFKKGDNTLELKVSK